MMNAGVRFENGTYGLAAVLTGGWSETIAKEIRKRQCSEIEINHAKGWRGTDLLFLASFPHLVGLKVIDFTIASVEPIHALHQLRALEVITYCRTTIRFTEFPLLVDCGLQWRSGSESLFGCTTLRRLFVDGYTGKDSNSFSRLVNLESLAVLNAPIKNLFGLTPLARLRSLRLANLRKLSSLQGVEALECLEELEIHTCPAIGSIEEVGFLPRLRRLWLNNDGDIASLKPLDRLEMLVQVCFYESTNILDGDLSPLMRQKNLSGVSFQNRRHYSHKREDFAGAFSA
jgi:hypothetical protein